MLKIANKALVRKGQFMQQIDFLIALLYTKSHFMLRKMSISAAHSGVNLHFYFFYSYCHSDKKTANMVRVNIQSSFPFNLSSVDIFFIMVGFYTFHLMVRKSDLSSSTGKFYHKIPI